MKKTLLTAISSLACVAIASNAHAAVSYGAFMFNALDSVGTPINNGTYRMVIDVNPAPAGDTLIAPGVDISSTWNWDPADILLDMGVIGAAGGNGAGECFPYYTGAYPAGVDSTDKVYLIWSDSAFSVGGPKPASHYGVEFLGTAGTDPGDYSFFPNGGNAMTVVPASVPEPGSLAVMAISALGLIRPSRKTK